MTPHLLRLRHKNRLYYLLIGILLILVGCSSPNISKPETSAARKANPAYVSTVKLAAGDTPQAVASRYGGEIIVWEPGVYALLGTDAPALTPQAVGSSGQNNDVFYAGGEATAFISGKTRVWAGGTSRVWAGGTSRVWSGGSAGLWQQGTFTWMPENTAKWQQVRLQEAQAIATNLGNGVKVAVIDTGVDLNHPALVDALAPAGEWKDFYDGDAVPQEEGTFNDDGYGHGTNVAGIIRQVAPRATILPIRVLGPDGGGNVADLTAAIQYAVSKGADVINLSLGSEGSLFSAVDNAIKLATAKGVYVVASTGNTGDNAVTYPASSAKSLLGLATGSSKLISVASVRDSDVKSSFSTYGYPVKLTAPGESVFGPAPDMSLAAWSGTSQAAPMASGALALALGQRLKLFADVPEQLRSQGVSIDRLNIGYWGRLGSRLDIAAFVKSVVSY